jgi:2-phospho-L-lactate guanylyltransferase
MHDGACGPAAVLVPVKSFAAAKGRLAAVLSPAERAALARTTAARVLAAAAPLPVAVVCDDDEVAAWALAHGARVIAGAPPGLDAAVHHGVAVLAAEGVRRVAVAHADLPLAEPGDIAALATLPGVTLVPDRHGGGTNVCVVPTDAGFRFAYGPGSFRRHLAEARRCGAAAAGLRVVRRRSLTWDLDEPDDLEVLPDGWQRTGAAAPRPGDDDRPAGGLDA